MSNKISLFGSNFGLNKYIFIDQLLFIIVTEESSSHEFSWLCIEQFKIFSSFNIFSSI